MCLWIAGDGVKDAREGMPPVWSAWWCVRRTVEMVEVPRAVVRFVRQEGWVAPVSIRMRGVEVPRR